MFTAYAVASRTAPHSATREQLTSWGRQARRLFMDKVEKLFQRRQNPQRFEDISIHNILLDFDEAPGDRSRHLPATAWPEAREYLQRMREWGTRASWGGAAELRVLAGMSGRRVFLVEKHIDNTWQLFIPPLGTGGKLPDVCVAWSGDHYDAVNLPAEAWHLLYPSGSA